MAIIITNDTLDAVLITQYSDNDTVLLEIHKGSNNFMPPASIWNTIMAIDSTGRYTIWHDTTTTGEKDGTIHS